MHCEETDAGDWPSPVSREAAAGAGAGGDDVQVGGRVWRRATGSTRSGAVGSPGRGTAAAADHAGGATFGAGRQVLEEISNVLARPKLYSANAEILFSRQISLGFSYN